MDSGAYGMDIGTSLPALLKELLAIDGKFKIRLGMINPQHLNRFGDELLQLMKSDKFYKFIHIPVQSGSEKVCKAMNRPHTVADFKKWVKTYRKALPDISISTDIIVGYPTETEADFRQTLKLLRETMLDVVNLSKFTSRPGTKAAALKQLPTEVIKKRSGITAALLKKLTDAKNKKYIGKTIEVLMLEKGKEKSMKGRSNNYKQVVLMQQIPLGKIVKARIKSVNHGSLFGSVVA
jgi:MiaB/RimO family radical SAM methylthiotransferase